MKGMSRSIICSSVLLIKYKWSPGNCSGIFDIITHCSAKCYSSNINSYIDSITRGDEGSRGIPVFMLMYPHFLLAYKSRILGIHSVYLKIIFYMVIKSPKVLLT